MAAELLYEIEKADAPGKTRIISLSGEIDESNQSVLEKVFQEIIEDKDVSCVVFNIENLDYVNSGVIGLFAVWHEKFLEKKKTFVFAQANDHIYDILDLVGLISVVDHFTSIEEACLSFEG